MTCRSLTTQFRPAAAFTLIEVALALAVTVFGFVVLGALLPGGQLRLRQAMDVTVTAQIARQVASEAGLTDFAEVLRQAGYPTRMGWLPRRYFAATGREVAADALDRVYEVHARLLRHDQLPHGGDDRWDAHGQVALMVEIVALGAGYTAPLAADGLVDRARGPYPVAAFPFVLGGHAAR
jgi:uncharacterized protein (TIGR02598 family)